MQDVIVYDEVVTELRGLVALSYMLLKEVERDTVQSDALEFLFQRLEKVAKKVEDEFLKNSS